MIVAPSLSKREQCHTKVVEELPNDYVANCIATIIACCVTHLYVR